MSELHPDCPSCLRPLGRRYVAVDALLSAVRDDLALHDNTGDPFDEGYKQALSDVHGVVAALSEEGERDA